MQLDHVLKKMNFDLFTPQGRRGDLRAKYLLPCCCIEGVARGAGVRVWRVRNRGWRVRNRGWRGREAGVEGAGSGDRGSGEPGKIGAGN